MMLKFGTAAAVLLMILVGTRVPPQPWVRTVERRAKGTIAHIGIWRESVWEK